MGFFGRTARFLEAAGVIAEGLRRTEFNFRGDETFHVVDD
jgi:hypothetical protein